MGTTVSLCMIVRNEAQNIRRCLESVAGAVDEIIVVDTGSTDETCQIAREAGARVYRFLWNENFSDARNFSLEQAKGDWILFLDADEELAGESREVLKKLVAEETVEGYFVKIINYIGSEGWTETCPDLVFRLFRNRREYRFRGAIHEQIANVILEKNSNASYRVAENMVIIHYGYLDVQIAEKQKKERNLKLIQRELGQDPDNRLLRYHYGVELFRAERYAEAAEELTRAANGIDPNTIYLPKLLRYIVMAHHYAGQPDRAFHAARLGLRLFPDYADLYYYLGLIDLGLKRYAEASRCFQRAVSMPQQPARYASFAGVRGFRSYFHLGRIAETFLDQDKALEYYMASLRDNPEFTPALESMVRILNPRENPKYTVECLEKAFEFCTPRANLMIGQIFFRQGAYGPALEYLEKGTADGPVPPEIELWKVICLTQQRRYLEALRIIGNFPRDSSLYPLAKFNQLFCFWIHDKKRKVRVISAELCAMGLAEDTERVLGLLLDTLDGKNQHIPETVLGKDGIVLLLDIIKRLLDMNEAGRAERLLSAVSPETLAKYRLKLAQLFYEYGFRERAETILKEHLAANRNAEAHYLLAEIYREKDSFDEAERHYRRALELSQDEPRYYIRLIQLYDDRRGKILQEAVRRYPDIDIFSKLAGEDRAT